MNIHTNVFENERQLFLHLVDVHATVVRVGQWQWSNLLCPVTVFFGIIRKERVYTKKHRVVSAVKIAQFSI